MPREQVKWYVKQSLHDDDRIHARQCCTYYSIVNVNNINYPYSSSVEREQTWTLTQTMSNHNKRYQSSIENIHLTIPTTVTPLTSETNQIESENDKTKIDRTVSLLPPLPPSRQRALLSHRLNRMNNMDSKLHQQQTLTSSNSSSKTNAIVKKPQAFTNPMSIIHVNGEFVVRI